jgi:hypothetical protein
MMDIAFGGKRGHLEGRYLALILPNDLPLEAMHYTFGLVVTLGARVLMMVVRFDYDLAWLMERRTFSMVTHGLWRPNIFSYNSMTC